MDGLASPPLSLPRMPFSGAETAAARRSWKAGAHARRAALEANDCKGFASHSTNGSKSSPPHSPVRDSKAIRGQAYNLRSASRNLVGDIHDSVACCGFVRRAFRPYGQAGQGDPDMATLVCEDGKASFVGTTRCGSPWACPVCAPRISSARAQTLMPQVASLMEAGWSAWLVTLTVRHDRTVPLLDTWGILSKAWGRLTSGKAWDALRKKGGLEWVRGYDVTHSNSHGWHPHLHISLYLSPDHKDPKAVAKWIQERWMATLSRLGWQALPGAQHVVQANDAAAAAKYSVTPAACYEAVAMALKRARTGKSGRTPFEILESAAEGDLAARHLWREYVAATKGRRQVNTSKGIFLKDPEPDVVQDRGEAIADLGPDAMSELDRRRLSAPLLDAVEHAAPENRREAARVILLTLESKEWGMCRPVPSAWQAVLPPCGPPGPQPSQAGKTRRERDQIAAYQEWLAVLA